MCEICDDQMRNDTMGEQSWPFGQVAIYRRWFRGGATIHGWTWFGFATEADMQAFLAAWPNPEGDGSKQAPADGGSDGRR